jgi:phosphoribosylamine---glycine ligase
MNLQAPAHEAPRGPSRVLVVGSGGREHALVWSLAREASVEAVLVAPGSDAIGDELKVVCYPDVSAMDPAAIVALATNEQVDLVVVGPEAPLSIGVADALAEAGILVFGPVKDAARLEWSKAFCRDVAAAAGVRMARGEQFFELEPALAFARELAEARGSGGVVVKADGLAAGKGVNVCDDYATAEAAIRSLFAAVSARAASAGAASAGTATAGAAGAAPGSRPAQPVLVLEERLFGEEASLIALCDGHGALALPPARDHKRLLDGDKGPNTGGMGAYSPIPDLPESLCATLVDVIHVPVLAEMARRGTPFRGALYAGLMLTPEGPVLIEFNARFGDPEIQAILPRLAVPIGPLLAGAARGDLASAAASLGVHGQLLPTVDDAAVAIILAAQGYPDEPRKGDRISGLDAAATAGATVFHAGTSRGADGDFVTNGGRVLAVVALAPSIETARRIADDAAGQIEWSGMQRRRDIAAALPPSSPAAGQSPATRMPVSESAWEKGGSN